MVGFARSAVWVSLVVASTAAAFEEPTRRQEVDAGMHIPVLTRAPELLHFEPAAYPAEAQARGLTASVKLIVTIGADGQVGDAQVPAPVGDGFDEAAIAAVKRFSFSAAEVDGVPAPVQIEYVYHFVLQVPDAGVEPDAGVKAPLPATLKGQLLVRGSRSFIAGALVRCSNQDVEAVSDEKGFFSLQVAAGLCEVAVVAPEFHTFQTKEVLEPGEVREVKYFVRQKVVGYETVVRGDREKTEVVTRTLTREELQKVPGSFGDPVRVIQNFPGVARAPFVLGQLIVRGANPNQTLTFFDGVDIPLLFHLGGGPSVVNGEFLDRVDFFPGGFGARYGRAVGGIVDVASRRGAADTWHGVVKVDLQDASLFLEVPITEGVSLAGAVRRSYIDALIPIVLPLVAPPSTTGGSILVLPVYWDYQLRLDVGAKRGSAEKNASTFSLFAFGSDDFLKVVATGAGRNAPVTIDVRTTFHRLQGTWLYRTGNVTFKLVPYAGLDLATADLGGIKVSVNEYTQGLRQDLQVETTPWLTLRVGADIYNKLTHGDASIPLLSGTQFVSFPGDDPVVPTQRVVVDIQSFDGALYTEADLKLWKFTMTPGVRVSSSFINGRALHVAEPRLWARFEPTDWTAIKGSVGLYTQPPDGTNMEPPPLGTPTLTHEKAFQASLGWSQKITDVINFDLTGFYNRRFENVVSPGPTIINADGSITDERFANTGLGRAYGLELMVRHEVTKHFFGWLAYTLSRSEQRRAGSGRDYVLSTYDQTHILTLVASYRFDAGWEVGARFRYVTGRPKTPLEHASDYYRDDTNSYLSTRGDPNSARVPDFNQLDLRVDKYFVFEKWTLDVFADVQNVYNMKNVEASFYDYRYRKEYEVPGIPILPIVGAKATF